MEQLTKVFTYDSAEVRTVMVGEEPWFVAKDVCAVLDVGNPSQALTRLDDDERNTIILNEGIRGNPNVTIVSESGLYSLIIGSRKPEARAFKRWITHEVIPSIRKSGMYATDALLDDPELMLKTVTRLTEERRARLIAEERAEALQLETAQQAEVIEEQAERLTYTDEILRSADTMTVTQIAADYDLSAVALNVILEDARVQRKVGGQWVLYRSYHGLGLTKSNTRSVDTDYGPKAVVSTQWTQAGRLLIHRVLIQRGLSALFDRGSDLSNRQSGSFTPSKIISMPVRQQHPVVLKLRADAK